MLIQCVVPKAIKFMWCEKFHGDESRSCDAWLES